MHKVSEEREPIYYSGFLASKHLLEKDVQNQSPQKIYESSGSNFQYDDIKDSENEISSHIHKVNTFQNARLAEQLKHNVFYKREIDALRSNLSSTGSKVKSNHYPEDNEDYLFESSKKKLRNLQHQREKELGYEFDEETAEKAKIRARQSLREDEVYKELYPKDEAIKSNRLKDSLTSNKITGGLRVLEEKMNAMERELDDHLTHNKIDYFTNKELIKEKQKLREREILKEKEFHEEENTTEEDDEELRMKSMKEKQQPLNGSSKKNGHNNFKNAFSKREERLAQENQEREISNKAQHSPESDSSQEGKEGDVEEFRIREDHRRRAFQDELDLLKEENKRIKNELHHMRETYELEKRYGNVNLEMTDQFPYEDYQGAIKSKKILIQRKNINWQHDTGFESLKNEQGLQKTINAARNNVHEKMRVNKSQEAKSMNKKKKDIAIERQPQFLGQRNDIYKRYYGYPTHLKEATYLLNKGIPTSYMSDSKPEVSAKDPKKLLPKRYEKTVRR